MNDVNFLHQAGDTIMTNRAMYLFARPSFARGAARCFDLGNTLSEYNTSPNGKIADSIAIYNDWRAVGDDIVAVIADYEQKEKAKDKQTACK